MANRSSRVSDRRCAPPDDLLDSWKEIALYFQRSIRTIQRWERLNGLPVHRNAAGRIKSVYAYKAELDAWRTGVGSSLIELKHDEKLKPQPAVTVAARTRHLALLVVVSVVAVSVGFWLGHDRLKSELPPPADKLTHLAQPTRPHPVTAEAYEAYLMGRFFSEKRTEAGLRRGLAFLDEAIAKEPRYAEAYVESAKAYTSLAVTGSALPDAVMPQARAAVAKALQLDTHLADAYFARARVRWQGDWDWSGAEQDFKRALQLDSASPDETLYANFLAALGRYDEAIAAARRARERNPLSVTANEKMGEILYLSGRYDEARAQLRNTIEMDPNSSTGHFHLAKVYLETGQFEDAMTEARAAAALSKDNPRMLSMLIYVSLRAGHRAEALDTLAQLKALSIEKHVSPMDWARVYIGLGDMAQTLTALDEAYKERMNPIVYLKIDPTYARLRPSPQFQDLLRRIGLAG